MIDSEMSSRSSRPACRTYVFLALAAAAAPLGAQLGPTDPSGQHCRLERRFSPARPNCGGPSFPSLDAGSPALTIQGGITLLPLTLDGYVRSAYPMDRDNGEVWAGRGVSTAVRFGVAGSHGPFHFSLYPAAHWSQNAPFPVADTVVDGRAPEAYPWELASIDWPQRPGEGPQSGLAPGESWIEVRGPSGSRLGIGTERLWWGPTRRYPLLLGNSAPGFVQAYGHTPTLPLGSTRLSVAALVGQVEESAYFDLDPSNDIKVLTALRVEWWTAPALGLHVAVTSMIRQPRVGLRARDFLDLVPLSSSQDARDRTVDGIGVVSARWRAADARAEVYGTWGRGDFFANFEDLLTEPEHNQFWAVGTVHRWPAGRKSGEDGAGESASRWELVLEHAATTASSTQFGLRTIFDAAVYRHSDAGHSHRGQLLGASIGPGAVGTWAGLTWTGGERTVGLSVERVLWDVDAAVRTLRALHGRDVQDREYLLGGGFADRVAVPATGTFRLHAAGGLAFRRDRQYVRYTGANDALARDQTNVWAEIRLSWTPPSS